MPPTFLLQYGAAAALADVVLHVAGVVPQVRLLHRVKGQGQLHLLLSQVLLQEPAWMDGRAQGRAGTDRDRRGDAEETEVSG